MPQENGPAESGETDYYVQRNPTTLAFLPRNAATSPYTSTAVDNIPTGTDMIALSHAGSQTLTFDLRVDTDKIPGDLLRAYYAVELKALTKNNPSGFPSLKQKREAKGVARERLEQEAKDGRFKRRKCVPVLWDAKSNEVLFGATSLTHIDRLTSLFRTTFGYDLEAITAGTRAYQLAELHQRTRKVDDSSPSAFVPGLTPEDVA